MYLKQWYELSPLVESTLGEESSTFVWKLYLTTGWLLLIILDSRSEVFCHLHMSYQISVQWYTLIKFSKWLKVHSTCHVVYQITEYLAKIRSLPTNFLPTIGDCLNFTYLSFPMEGVGGLMKITDVLLEYNCWKTITNIKFFVWL